MPPKAINFFSNRTIIHSPIIALKPHLVIKVFSPDNGLHLMKVKVANKYQIKQVIMKTLMHLKSKILLQELEILLKKGIKIQRMNKCYRN